MKSSIYIASPLGFSLFTSSWYRNTLLPRLAERGWETLDPWQLPIELRRQLEFATELPLPEAMARFHSLNRSIGSRNERLIRTCRAMLALLDGSDVDSGTAAEIGFAYAIGKPIVGYRSDFRLAGDNFGSAVNLQVEYFVEESGGSLIRLTNDPTDEDLVRVCDALSRVLEGGRPSM